MAKRETYGGQLIIPEEYFRKPAGYWDERIARLKADCVLKFARDLPEGRKFVVEFVKEQRRRYDCGLPVNEIRVRANLMEVDQMEIREFSPARVDYHTRPVASVELPKPRSVATRIADYLKWMCREVEYDGPRG